METTPLLLILDVCLACAWIAYRAERQLHAEQLRHARERRPDEAAAMLSAMSAMTHRAERAIAELTATKRRAEPLPGTQRKAGKARQC